MELLVATWVLRIAVVAALAVGGASYQAGTPVVDCVDRALLVAVAFTFAGRWLIGWLEPPERRLVRMRKKREARRAKSVKSGSAERVAAAKKSKSNSTLTRTA
jgi:hypothetical protein